MAHHHTADVERAASVITVQGVRDLAMVGAPGLEPGTR